MTFCQVKCILPDIKIDFWKGMVIFLNLLLVLAFLFCIGSVAGWTLELFFRRFISKANPEHKWINPGFCTGPYLPLYGVGLCLLFLIASLEKYNIISNPIWNKIALFGAMAVCMTIIEYIAGVISLKITKVRLWDYSEEWGNIGGIVCPKFSFYWAVLGALYYFLIHPHILGALSWLSQNLAFSFFVGFFFGVFIIDAAHSAHFVAKLKAFAEENNVIVKYENLKSQIRSFHDKTSQKSYFLFPFRSDKPFSEYMKEFREDFEKRIGKK